jgi:hypothetical protein
MQRRMKLGWYSADFLFPFIVLILLVWFTYVFLVQVPYGGFYFIPTNGEVLEVYVETNPMDLLQKGDFIESVNGISWDSYKQNATQEFFNGVQGGQVVEITINRKGEKFDISWPFPGFNLNEFSTRFVNIWWLGYIFWLFGFLTQHLIRPKDNRWWLMITANYLTGLWLVCGTLSSSHAGMSLLVLRAATWLIMPVYLNLHWNFPQPIFRVPRTLWMLF